MTFVSKLWLILSVCVATIVSDQLSKWWAANHLSHFSMQRYWADTVRIGYTENTGAFLGLGSTLSETMRFWLFVAAVGVVLLALLVYLLKSQSNNRMQVTALSFIFAGGLSNFYDRAMNDGAVIDFLNVGIGSLRTGIFNVADMAIMLGVLLLLLVRDKPQKP
ncbi:MAG: signal peptidase II [Paraglaciecola sp.]|nr:signal peptidase II [Paraglaciecola sp.]NCT49486.1 signal peptidase II [Paraglaciecola sp.]